MFAKANSLSGGNSEAGKSLYIEMRATELDQADREAIKSQNAAKVKDGIKKMPLVATKGILALIAYACFQVLQYVVLIVPSGLLLSIGFKFDMINELVSIVLVVAYAVWYLNYTKLGRDMIGKS